MEKFYQLTLPPVEYENVCSVLPIRDMFYFFKCQFDLQKKKKMVASLFLICTALIAGAFELFYF